MNTAELADRLAVDHDMPKTKAKQLLDAAFIALGEAIARGEEVSIQGFGKFKVTDRPAREGRNPATGEAIQIAASRKPAFTPAKQLKDKLNGASA
jgi:DNA-binding protein HU-beta